MNDNKNNIEYLDWFKFFRYTDIEIGDDIILNCTIPKEYDFHFPEIKKIEGYKVCDINDNYKYFKHLSEGKVKLCVIEGKNIAEKNKLYKKCNYCNVIIESKGYPIRKCIKCNKNMCSLCWEEKNEDIALRNGSKNWKRRKTDLLNCFQHEEKIIINYNLPINCDLCERSSNNVIGMWRCCRLYNIDLCPICFYTQRGQNFITFSNFKCEKVYYRDESDDRLEYGSILDWVLILKCEKENDYILCNINKKSKMYHRIALVSIDNQDRHGLFILNIDLGGLLDILPKYTIKDILYEHDYDIDFSE